MILNTFICTKSVNWVAKCWKISRGVSLGLHLAITFKVFSDCTINIYMYICYLLSFCMFYFWSTETWLEKRSNDINDPYSLNPGGICDSGLSLNRYLQAHPGDTLGNALQNWQHIYQLPRLNIQRCITYTYVHVCGYLFSTVVCYGYVCLVCVYMQVCVLMRIPSCIDLLPCHLFVSHVLIFFLYVYILNKWFLISEAI